MTSEEHGFWVTPREFSRLTGIPRQTLANWRYQDRRAGRASAAPGRPIYRKFGNCVRYFVSPELLRPEAAQDPCQSRSLTGEAGQEEK